MLTHGGIELIHGRTKLQLRAPETRSHYYEIQQLGVLQDLFVRCIQGGWSKGGSSATNRGEMIRALFEDVAFMQR